MSAPIASNPFARIAALIAGPRAPRASHRAQRVSTIGALGKRVSLKKIALIFPLLASLALLVGPLRAIGDSVAPPAKKHARKGPKPAPTPSALPVGVKIPVYSPGPLPFHDGELLVYHATWLGIPAADARVEFHKSKKDPKVWVAEVWIETNRFADLFYRMRDYMKERFDLGSLQTRDNYFRQDEKNRVNEYDAIFDRARGLVAMTKRSHKGVERHDFISANPWGPMSGTAMALSQHLEPERKLAFDVFTSNNRYVIDFAVGERVRIRVPAGDYDAIRLTPELVYLSNEKIRGEAHETTLWVSADARHLPLRIEAAAYIGTVRADLVQVDGQPAGDHPIGPIGNQPVTSR